MLRLGVASSSTITTVAVATTNRGFDGSLSVSVRVSSASSNKSLAIGTEIVPFPSGIVNTPDVAA